jgi:hypothetical protein
VENSNRKIIESQILASLDDESKVACIFNEDDLNLLIESLSWFDLDTQLHKSLLQDLRQLRKEAFGPKEKQ